MTNAYNNDNYGSTNCMVSLVLRQLFEFSMSIFKYALHVNNFIFFFQIYQFGTQQVHLLFYHRTCRNSLHWSVQPSSKLVEVISLLGHRLCSQAVQQGWLNGPTFSDSLSYSCRIAKLNRGEKNKLNWSSVGQPGLKTSKRQLSIQLKQISMVLTKIDIFC